MKDKYSVVLLLFWSFGLPALLAADAGKITFAAGTVEIERGGKWQKATLGAALDQADKLRTGRDGTAVVALRTGARLKLKPDSTVRLNSVDKATAVELQAGAVFAQVDTRKAGHTFEIRAQTTVAAVRGTEFFFAYGKQGKQKSDLWLCVNEGLVNVVDSATQSEVNVRAGEGIIIPTDKKIPKPKAYAWTKKLNWNMDTKNGTVEDKSNLKEAYSDLLRQNYD